MLYKVIPNEDFEIPDRMGSDGIPTGGRRVTREPRRRMKKGKGVASGSESEREQDDYREGYEVVRMLEQLLEKDPLTRITLQNLKVSHRLRYYGQIINPLYLADYLDNTRHP